MKLQMKPKTIVLLVVLILFLIILFQNSESIKIQLLFWQITEAPMFLLIGIVLVIGLLFGWVGHMVYARGKRSSQQAMQTPVPAQSSPATPPASDATDSAQ